jgi:hypothetical protein
MAPWQVAAACHSWPSQMMGEDNDRRPLEFADENMLDNFFSATIAVA